jgi:hypothetical protein
MPIPQESPAFAASVVSRRSPKLRQLLRKRLRQLLRITSGVAICLALAATAIAIWWLTSLNALPDIGDPFDVAAFRGFSVPDDQNAFTFLRRAQEKLTPSPPSLPLSWSQADPKARAWVESNREALALFREGAERSDAANPAGDSVVNGQRLALLVLLEGGKRQAGGDTAGAWDCYRAVLRMATHTRRRGSLPQRQDLDAYWNGWLQQRLATWAADPRITIPQLRNALDEVLKCEPGPDWDSFAIKAGYLEMMRSLAQPPDPHLVYLQYTCRVGDMQLPPDLAGYLAAARRFVLREPERSRRVLQRLYANWLAHLETPGLRPRKPAIRASFTLVIDTDPITMGTSRVPLYAVSPDAPDVARSLPPPDVARWLGTTTDAKLRILLANDSQWPWTPDRLRDRRAHGDLVLMVAREIYRRERGSPPPSDQALVGPYLKSLPDDGSAELDDGTVPTSGEPST